VADNAKAEEYIRWKPQTSREKGIADAIAWERSRRRTGDSR
jgi:nucleoside-diphosphate-sugar epimerase